MPKPAFRFKQFTVQQDRCAMKVSTDGVLFAAWVNVDDARAVLDIGTGTGVVALIAAQRAPLARIDAVEIDPAAAEQAAENAAASPWAHRVRITCADVRTWQPSARYDLILCNPPYYARYSTPADDRLGLAKHGHALLFTDLIAATDRLLLPTGRLAVIIPLHREAELIALAATIGLHPQRRCVVRYVAHRPPKRVLLELRRPAPTTPPHTGSLTIEATGPFDYTAEHRAMLKELMLNF